MNKFILCFIFSNLTVLFAQQPEQRSNCISVKGSVVLREIADQASLFFTVKGVGSTLHQAVENADQITKAIVVKLVSLGVKEKNVSTSSFYSGNNQSDKAFLSSSRDYQASITTLITIDSLVLLQRVLFTISESNVQDISQISFSLKDELGLRKRARIEATLKAKEKAEDIGKTLGIIIGKPISISEIPPGESSSSIVIRGVQARDGVDEYIGSSLFAQTVSIETKIYITFEIK